MIDLISAYDFWLLSEILEDWNQVPRFKGAFYIVGSSYCLINRYTKNHSMKSLDYYSAFLYSPLDKHSIFCALQIKKVCNFSHPKSSSCLHQDEKELTQLIKTTLVPGFSGPQWIMHVFVSRNELINKQPGWWKLGSKSWKVKYD